MSSLSWKLCEILKQFQFWRNIKSIFDSSISNNKFQDIILYIRVLYTYEITYVWNNRKM